MKRRTVLKLVGAPAAAALFGVGRWRSAVAAPDDIRAQALAPRTGPASVSERIAAFVNRTRFQDLPPQVVQKAKELLVFSFGRALEGCLGTAATQVNAVAPFLSQPHRGGASVIGQRYRLSPADAAFANCSLMRGDFGNDDVLWPAEIHSGPVTLPAALALAEVNRLSGRELILATVLGYEVMGKLGRAASGWQTAMPRRATTIYGAFGPVTTAGRLLKLDDSQLANAMGYAANIGIGIAEGAMMQHFYSFIARSGVLSAQLAGAGGAPYGRNTIEDPQGLYGSFFGAVPETLPALISALGSDWEILRAEQKHFFGTGHNAVAISLLGQILRDAPVRADDIDRIDVVLPYAKHAAARRNALVSQGPFKRPIEASSSLPYALALITLAGTDDVDPKWYAADADQSVINDPAVKGMMQRVFVTFEAGHASPRYCRFELATVQGRRIRKEVDDFNMPFPRSEWSSWLGRAGSKFLSDGQLKTLEHVLADLEHVDDASTLMAAVVPASGGSRR